MRLALSLAVRSIAHLAPHAQTDVHALAEQHEDGGDGVGAACGGARASWCLVRRGGWISVRRASPGSSIPLARFQHAALPRCTCTSGRSGHSDAFTYRWRFSNEPLREREGRGAG